LGFSSSGQGERGEGIADDEEEELTKIFVVLDSPPRPTRRHIA
jgi:hypothetical protein